jgi:hypothetical protein
MPNSRPNTVQVQALANAPAIVLFLNRYRAFRGSDSTDESDRATIPQTVENPTFVRAPSQYAIAVRTAIRSLHTQLSVVDK